MRSLLSSLHQLHPILSWVIVLSMVVTTTADEAKSPNDDADQAKLTATFEQQVKPFLKTYCLDCHGETKQEAKLDLSPFTEIAKVRADLGHWELVLMRLGASEMPPEDAPRIPPDKERQRIVQWIRDLRTFEANKNAGDPGPVLARRLNNTEYDNTVRDLTGVDIRPTREFPVDPANVAGFANSGESLTMSPALFDKYLAAARHVADHLVLLPSGFAFSPHPALTYSDRDKFAVRRVVDFYLAINLDYAEFLIAAWQYKHREALDQPELTLARAAADHAISPKYLATLWNILTDGKHNAGPIAELRERWNALPTPNGVSNAAPVGACRAVRDWLLEERKKRQFEFPSVLIPQLNPTTQPGVLWKNRLIEEHRRLGTITDEERADAALSASIARFCSTFPDEFMLTERGRMNLRFEEQNKGRLLGAGFHLQVGYYRDDRPLYDLVLDQRQKEELDRLWNELFFVTDGLVRQFQDYIYFERAEGREVINAAEFDFARGEDRTVASKKTMAKIARLYVEAVRKRGLEEEALKEIAAYFARLSKRIRTNERAVANAEPVHLQALLRFAERAWRRPLDAQESGDLLQFYRELREVGRLNHEDAIRDVVTSILTSPYFCYRVDVSRESNVDNRLTGYAVANRLSYFLWSSMPDERLLDLAGEDRLQQSSDLRGQVQRMLADRRSSALAVEFAGNWLDYRTFQTHVSVDRTKFPQFTDELREAMFQEPVRFFADWVQRDGRIRELLDARHTFVNGVLAAHYQIPYSEDRADASGWMRVDDAADFGRGGLLPMAVFLTKSSPGLRTSPVKRGYWVVRQLLGEHIPAPPADVPELPQDESDLGDLTLRQVLAKHREVKSCAACHEKFDFAGLVFEGYGPIGERRSQDLGGRSIDNGTIFPDGTQGRGLAGLKAYLVKERGEQFVDTFCRRLLAYALGRGLLLSDDPLIDRMRQAVRDEDDQFSTLVKMIVESPQFLWKRRLQSDQAPLSSTPGQRGSE